MIVESDRTAEPREKSLEEAKKSLFWWEFNAVCSDAELKKMLFLSVQKEC